MNHSEVSHDYKIGNAEYTVERTFGESKSIRELITELISLRSPTISANNTEKIN